MKNSYENFLERRMDDLHLCCKYILLLQKKDIEEIEKGVEASLSNIYDTLLVEELESMIEDHNTTPTSERLATLAIRNENRNGTEKQMVIEAIFDLANYLGVYIEEIEEDLDCKQYKKPAILGDDATSSK